MKKIREYLNPSGLELHYKNDMLDVTLYDEIILLTDNEIILSKNNKQIVIKGCELTLLKLLDSEVLIKGEIKTIEL